jgi:hypothetical protein
MYRRLSERRDFVGSVANDLSCLFLVTHCGSLAGSNLFNIDHISRKVHGLIPKWEMAAWTEMAEEVSFNP